MVQVGSIIACISTSQQNKVNNVSVWVCAGVKASYASGALGESLESIPGGIYSTITSILLRTLDP